MTDRDLMQQALDALELHAKQYPHMVKGYTADAASVLRERLSQPEQKPVAWGVFDGPNLHDVNFTEEEAQEMMRLKGDGSVVKPLYTSPQPQMQPCAGRNCGSTDPNLHSAECFEDYEKATGMSSVEHAVIAGALFDFMGWLTSRKEHIVLSSSDNASPAVDAIAEVTGGPQAARPVD